MKKRKFAVFCLVLAILCLFPIRFARKDGGTVEYHAVLYTVSKVHKLAPFESGKEFLEGTIVKILGVEVYNDVA